MANLATRAHPLADRVFASNGVSISPLAECERVSLRADEKAIAGLGKALGISLPSKPGASAQKGETLAIWIGPDEWFVSAEAGSDIETKLNKVKTGLYSAVSIDHRNTGVMVSGPKAVNALNSGCARDLSLEAFPIGTGSRTMLAKAEIILFRTSEDSFRIECWRSFSDYVWKYLMDAARSA